MNVVDHTVLGVVFLFIFKEKLMFIVKIDVNFFQYIHYQSYSTVYGIVYYVKQNVLSGTEHDFT